MTSIETDDVNENKPVYAVYFPDEATDSSFNFYSTVQDAVKFVKSPEVKPRGARFRCFGTQNEALNYLQDQAKQFRDSAPVLSGGDPAVPFQAPTRIEMNRFKSLIEDKYIDDFDRLINELPRYLINTSGDCPAIVQEGFRYNVLHIAARNNAAKITKKVLESVSDLDYLTRIYNTNTKDVELRRENILLGFFNTPDKGSLGMPLIIALKFGHIETVQVLLEFINLPVCDSLRSKIAFDVATFLDESVLCSRYQSTLRPKEEVMQNIKDMFSALYVPLYRAVDKSRPARVFPPTNFPRKLLLPNSDSRLPNILPTASPRPLECAYELAAYAGPFFELSEAAAFHKQWTTHGIATKRSDMDKGYEKVGRELCQLKNISWSEYWIFLDEFCDVQTERGLELVENYLLNLRKSLISYKEDSIRRDFGELRTNLFPGNAGDDTIEGAGEPADNDVSLDTQEIADDVEDFSDAKESFEECSTNPDDSLLGITQRLASITLNALLTNNQMEAIAEQNDEFNSDDEYGTPPPSPPPIFVLEEPTKLDNDLYIALRPIPSETLQKYPQIDAFVRQMSKVAETSRKEWPSTDSPRCPRTPGKQRLLVKRRLDLN